LFGGHLRKAAKGPSRRKRKCDPNKKKKKGGGGGRKGEKGGRGARCSSVEVAHDQKRQKAHKGGRRGAARAQEKKRKEFSEKEGEGQFFNRKSARFRPRRTRNTEGGGVQARKKKKKFTTSLKPGVDHNMATSRKAARFKGKKSQ